MIRSIIKILTLAAVLGLPGISCIDDDLKDCRRGLVISFYSQSECQSSPVYPSDIDRLLVCIFDRDGLLVTHFERTGITISDQYNETVQLDAGSYSVVVWSGLDEKFMDIYQPTNGVTHKSDLLFSLETGSDRTVWIEGSKIYHGDSGPVFIDESRGAELFTEIAVNLLEITNRLNLTVNGLSSTPRDYFMSLTADNGAMNLDGTIATAHTVIYTTEESSVDGILSGGITILKLEKGLAYPLKISTAAGIIVYEGDLLEDLILRNPTVNLNCVHDFNIDLTSEEGDTYIITEIYVNDWLVHSYETDF